MAPIHMQIIIAAKPVVPGAIAKTGDAFAAAISFGAMRSASIPTGIINSAAPRGDAQGRIPKAMITKALIAVRTPYVKTAHADHCVARPTKHSARGRMGCADASI
ncbi:MAG: hypothetical protein M0R76_00530 [Proteobacteria bacterium]|nr:hypothetical protein [Pseudomonadota bacterium]